MVENSDKDPLHRGGSLLPSLSVLYPFGREVKAYEDEFDAKSYEAKLILDLNLIKINFPETFDSDQRG